jgi:SAM-dependent methyltransferase
MDRFHSFGEMERDGWSDAARAEGYVDLFAAASDQAIGSLLAAVDAAPSMRVLDLCCGQGNVSEALLAKGCEVVGVDFSPAMLAMARRRAPGAIFMEADAQDLPFEEGEFDAVVSNVGICHVPDQPRALSEARRVLRSGGRFGMTVWCGPDVSPGFQAFYGAVKVHGDSAVSLPDGPDFHQFANPKTAETLLAQAGFSDVDLAIVNCYWDLDTPAGLGEIFEKATVRAAMLLRSQPPGNLAAIRSAMESAVREQFSHGDRWRVPVLAAVVKAAADPV